jgi:hypothetical protein
MVTGLSLAAIALYMQSTLTASSTYADLLVPFMIMGLGMGLTMSPMSTAAMNSVAATKAGVASGILSMSRMVGGTFGVAAIGALFQSLAKDRLASNLSGMHLSAAQHSQVVNGISTGTSKKALAGLDPATAQHAGRAMKDAFVHALSGSLKLSTAVAAAGAVLALVLVESKKKAGVTDAVAVEPAAAAATEQLAA